MDLMAADTIAFLDKVVGGPVRLVGYSAGGLVALLVARRRPDLVERLVLVSTAFDLDGMIYRPTVGGEPPAPIVDAYAEVSPDGRDHFPVVLAKIVEAVTSEESPLTAADLAEIGARTLVMVGDDDMVTLDHTLALYRGLADAELAVVPAATHLLLFEKPALCTELVAGFLTADRAPMMMPIRRA
jgi:pimeloyl-ACP methyl ester carboxylesterase